jgi:enoyl-[acyl-carrier protein] reductase II
MLGAEGVQVGTRFLASEEVQINPVYKELVIKAKDTDSIVTGRFTGHPCRNVKTKFSKKLQTFERDGGTPEEFEEITLGSLRKAVQDGNLEEGSFLCGAIAGMITEVKPCADIIKEMFDQAETLLKLK